MNSEKKYRNELKYICTEAELKLLEFKIKNICNLDNNVSEEGTYRIRSIYFDDYNNKYFYENENGTDPREKFRIRIYNLDNSHIKLECKQKEKTMTHKESCSISMEEYEAIMAGKWNLIEAENPLLRRFVSEMNSNLLTPKVIVDYERQPYVYKLGNVRITFDRNISSGKDMDKFFSENLSVRPIMPLGKNILEVKYDEFIPDYLYRLLNLRDLRQTAFSKYYLCRKYGL